MPVITLCLANAAYRNTWLTDVESLSSPAGSTSAMKTSGTIGAIGILAALFCIALTAFVEAHDSADAVTVLGSRNASFTINGEPAFLLGISYYSGLGASEDLVRKDLDDLQRCGFNWLRVWATWGAFEKDVSAVNASGEPRRSFDLSERRLFDQPDVEELKAIAGARDILKAAQ